MAPSQCGFRPGRRPAGFAASHFVRVVTLLAFGMYVRETLISPIIHYIHPGFDEWHRCRAAALRAAKQQHECVIRSQVLEEKAVAAWEDRVTFEAVLLLWGHTVVNLTTHEFQSTVHFCSLTTPDNHQELEGVRRMMTVHRAELRRQVRESQRWARRGKPDDSIPGFTPLSLRQPGAGL